MEGLLYSKTLMEEATEYFQHCYDILGSERQTDVWSEMVERKVVWNLIGEVGWGQIRQGFEGQEKDKYSL